MTAGVFFRFVTPMEITKDQSEYNMKQVGLCVCVLK